MSQIEIRVLKQGIKSRHVMTCCLFTMEGAYRDFRQYVGDFKKFLSLTDHLTQFELRVYTDDTAKDIALEAAGDNPRVSVLHYNCPEFREGKGHVGIFGMFVRFLPMFEDLDTVWCSDIDISRTFTDVSLLNKMVENNCDVLISTFVCYEVKAWARINSIVASKFIIRRQFPRALLTRFLNMLADGRLSDKIDRINAYNISHYSSRPANRVPYGTDELFLNTYIYNHIMSHNFKVLLSKDYNAIWLIYKLDKEGSELVRRYRFAPNHQTFVKLKKLIQKSEPKPEMASHPCYKEMMDALPDLKNSFVKNMIIRGSDL
jgi:hypothetical protein